MTDLKRRSLVAALGAAPLAVPLLTRCANDRRELEVQSKYLRVNGSGSVTFRILS